MRNHRRAGLAALTALVLTVASADLAAGGPGQGRTARLQMYEATVTAEQVQELGRQGFDVVSAEDVSDGVAIQLVLSGAEAGKLRSQGIQLSVARNAQGKTATQLAAEQASGGYNVWKDYDGSDGIRQLLYDIAQRNSPIVKLKVLGQTLGTDPEGDAPDQPREIIAL